LEDESDKTGEATQVRCQQQTVQRHVALCVDAALAGAGSAHIANSPAADETGPRPN